MVLLFACAFSKRAEADTVTAFAAASLKPVLDQLAPEFEDLTGHTLQLSYAGSALLARQIAQGAPADVFLSANTQWMTYLEDLGAVFAPLRFTFAQNRLALISSQPQDGGQDPQTVLSNLSVNDRLAMGFVRAVPAGQYGKEALEYWDLWSHVVSHVVEVDNVRAALNLVHLKEVRFGIVYASDAHNTKGVSLVGLFPAGIHRRITYPVAPVGTKPGAATTAFLNFLQSKPAELTLKDFGFLPAVD